MAKEKEQRNSFKLEVPLDASGVDNFAPDLAVRAMVVDRAGKKYSKVTKLDARGSGLVTFEFPNKPGSLRLVLGPRARPRKNCQVSRPSPFSFRSTEPPKVY